MPPPATQPTPRHTQKRADATRTLVLDTAERLFAEHGYDATGVRQIAEQAGVNLGAIHYYWRTKEALCRATLERRMLPILEQRKSGIEQAAAQGASLVELLDASHRPSLLVSGTTPEQAESFRRLYGRMLFDPSPEVQAILAALLDGFARRFVELIRAHTPHLDDDEFYWRITFMYGAFLYAHTRHTRTMALWGDKYNRADTARAADYLNRFIQGGLMAAAMPPAGKRAGRSKPAPPDARPTAHPTAHPTARPTARR